MTRLMPPQAPYYPTFAGQTSIRIGFVMEQHGPNPGPSSEQTYKVGLNTDSGVNEFDGVRSWLPRWWDFVPGTMTQMCPIGRPVLCLLQANEIYCLIPEGPEISECPPQGGGA